MFSLSQAGMIKHHLRFKEPNWQRGLAINAVGCVATTVVLGVVVVSKFVYGAWIPVVVIPIIVMIFQRIHRHYLKMDTRMAAAPVAQPVTAHIGGDTVEPGVDLGVAVVGVQIPVSPDKDLQCGVQTVLAVAEIAVDHVVHPILVPAQ